MRHTDARRASNYIRSHIVVTTSGMCSADPLLCAIGALGAERVLFSVDYPYESSEHASSFIDSAPVDEETRRLVCVGNAVRLLGLTAP